AADNDADGRATGPDGILGARRRATVRGLEGDAFFLHAAGFLFRQNGATDEIALVERDKETDAGFDGSGVFVEFVTVERVADLGAERVARAQPGGHEPERPPELKHFVPNALDGRVFAGDFKAVLAGVAGTGNQDATVFKMESANLVFLQTGHASHAHG